MSRNPSSTKVRNVLQDESRLKRGIAAGIVLCLSGAIAAGTFTASAAVPAAPNNIVVFPNRDFITVEGYADHAGEQALLEVWRGSRVIGSAVSTISGGDVAFEINHPGGVCWGAGTSLQVTPDIQPGDKATLSFAGKSAGDTTAQNAYVKDVVYNGTNTVTVTGIAQLDTGIDAGNIEQRIVNPDLVALIGKRDIRAVPGGLTASAKTGPAGGYSSDLVVDADHNFTATYIFDTDSVAKLVSEGGGERFLSWQVTDADANRQGMTIAELGEPGGPGMGGCPAGPGDLTPPSGFYTQTRSADSLNVDWNAVKAQPTADPVTGYSIVAIAQSGTPEGVHEQIGRRTGPGARSVTITGLSATEQYDVEVRAIASNASSPVLRMGNQFREGALDTSAPRLDANVNPGADADNPARTNEVTFTSPDGGDIYYTLGTASAVDGDGPSDAAVPFRDPIAITAVTEIHAAAFDDAGNHTQLDGFYAPVTPDAPPPDTATDTPPMPTDLAGTPAFHAVSLTWTGDSSATSYAVRVYDSATATTPVTPPQTSQETSATVSNLAAGKEYWFTVVAHNVAGDSEPSAKAGPIKPVDAVRITTAKWKTGDLRVQGTGTDLGGAVSLFNANTNQRIGGATTAAFAPAAAPATGSTFDFRIRTGVPATNVPVYVVSSLGGKSATFQPANG